MGISGPFGTDGSEITAMPPLRMRIKKAAEGSGTVRIELYVRYANRLHTAHGSGSNIEEALADAYARMKG